MYRMRDHNVTLLFLLAVCVPKCLNGGHCSESDVCDCRNGYSGDRCETRMLQKLLYLGIILYTA